MEKREDSIEQCDIFDFMANYVGLSVLHPGGLKATDELAKFFGIHGATQVVDIACGKGTSAVYLAQKYGCQVVGIDVGEDLVEQAIALARRRGLDDKVTFRVADAINLPFPDDEFDVALSQAMLVLVNDKKKAVQEALRVTRVGGSLGWIELSWKKSPEREFLDQVSTVICAYCMLNVLTFDGWKNLFEEVGVKELEIMPHSMEFQGMKQMITDEGFLNAGKILFRYLTNSRIRKRMNTMQTFFKDNAQYFGYGIYIGRK